MNRFDRYTSSLAPSITPKMVALGGIDYFGNIKNDPNSTVQYDTSTGYQIDRGAAANILTAVMRNTPAAYRKLFSSLPETIIIDPTLAPAPRNADLEPQTGVRRLGLDLHNLANPLREEPNAALGAAFMSATLETYRQRTMGIKGPIIATALFVGIAETPTAIMNQMGQPQEGVLATAVLGAGVAAWLLSKLFADTPAIAASDRLLPIGDHLIYRAATIGSLAVPKPCLTPIAA